MLRNELKADWTMNSVIAMLKFHFDTNISVTPAGFSPRL